MKHDRKQPLSVKKLIHLANMQVNVLLVGHAGVGKTMSVQQTFQTLGLKYQMFSGATLDPWIDFIGLPRVVDEQFTDEFGNVRTEKTIEYARPKAIARDEVEVIFIDELNRSHKKVRNAIMELIQFKSINGKKLKNLKMVWAAINPDDDEEFAAYDVEKLDPAQQDRFQVKITIPYEPNKDYYIKKYGSDIAVQLIKWWNLQTEDVRKNISPRRLEYAVQHYKGGGDIKDVITHVGATTDKLIEMIGSMPKIAELQEIFKKNNNELCKKFLIEESNYDLTIGTILQDQNSQLLSFCLPNFPEEKASLLIANNWRVATYAMQKCSEYPAIREILEEIAKANQNKHLSERIKTKLASLDAIAVSAGTIDTLSKNPDAITLKMKNDKNDNYQSKLSEMSSNDMRVTSDRLDVYNSLINNMPNKMTGEQAKETLMVINSLIGKSPKTSIDKYYPQMMGILNVAYENIASNNESVDLKQCMFISKFISERDGFIFNQSSNQLELAEA